MSKRIKCGVVVAVFVVCISALGVLLTPPVSAASGCWQVDCNTCCRGAHGGVICTQRACV